jgi:hypothetical protein
MGYPSLLSSFWLTLMSLYLCAAVIVDRPSSRERQLEAENEKLKAKIGDLVMQMDHIKKLQAWVQRKRNADISVITAKNLDQFRKPAK